MIKTAHIRQMLRDAERLADEADMRDAPEVVRFDADDHLTDDRTRSMTEILARAANLAEHAAAELRDEIMRADGWL